MPFCPPSDCGTLRLSWRPRCFAFDASCRVYLTTDGPSVVLRYPLVSLLQRSFKESPAGSGNDRSPNYRSFPRITVIDPAGSVYMPSGVAAVLMFLSSEGVLQYCTRATDPTNGWLMCLASSMTR